MPYFRKSTLSVNFAQKALKFLNWSIFSPFFGHCSSMRQNEDFWGKRHVSCPCFYVTSFCDRVFVLFVCACGGKDWPCHTFVLSVFVLVCLNTILKMREFYICVKTLWFLRFVLVWVLLPPNIVSVWISVTLIQLTWVNYCEISNGFLLRRIVTCLSSAYWGKSV